MFSCCCSPSEREGGQGPADTARGHAPQSPPAPQEAWPARGAPGGRGGPPAAQAQGGRTGVPCGGGAPPPSPPGAGAFPGFASRGVASPAVAGGARPRTPPPGAKFCKCSSDGKVPTPQWCSSGNCGCRRRGEACSPFCACAAAGGCCAWAAEQAQKGGAGGGAGGGASGGGTPVRKTHVHETFPSDDSRAAWRSKYLDLVRDKGLKSSAAVLRRTDRNQCLYSLRPRTWEQLDVEHVIEGQMDGYAIVSCPAAHAFFSYRLRQVDTSLPGFVRRSVLHPYYEVHNADLNLVFADHWSNMKKKAAVEHALKELECGRELERGLHGVLARQFATGTAPLDADEAEACARRVCEALRRTEPAYTRSLDAVSPAAPAFAAMEARDRATAARIYSDIGEFIGTLCDEGLRLGRK